MRRRTLLTSALAGGAALGLAACGDKGASSASGSATGGAMSKVTFSGAYGTEPKVSFTAPLTIGAPESKLLSKGTGEAIAEGDVLGLHTLYMDASTGKLLQSSWQGGPGEYLAVSTKSNGKEAAGFLKTARLGSRFAMLGQVTDGQGKTISVVQVSDILSKALARAQGQPQPVPADQPQFTLGADGAPQLSGKPTTPSPATTTAIVTIQGDGDQTAAGDTLAMHYTGWKLSDGSEFDSSWKRGEPFSFTLGRNEVIAGWDGPLTGQKVGSQMLLVIPPSEAYGDTGDLAGETLVFVADILGVVTPPSA